MAEEIDKVKDAKRFNPRGFKQNEKYAKPSWCNTSFLLQMEDLNIHLLVDARRVMKNNYYR